LRSLKPVNSLPLWRRPTTFPMRVFLRSFYWTLGGVPPPMLHRHPLPTPPPTALARFVSPFSFFRFRAISSPPPPPKFSSVVGSFCFLFFPESPNFQPGLFPPRLGSPPRFAFSFLLAFHKSFRFPPFFFMTPFFFLFLLRVSVPLSQVFRGRLSRPRVVFWNPRSFFSLPRRFFPFDS